MDMLKRAAGKIYGWIEPHMDNDKMLTKIKRVYICTDAAARDKCAEMYTDIIAKILLTLLVTCILAVILVARKHLRLIRWCSPEMGTEGMCPPSLWRLT